MERIMPNNSYDKPANMTDLAHRLALFGYNIVPIQIGRKGSNLHALWDDTKFSAKHCTDIEKLALVGDSTWQKWMAIVCKPFTMATAITSAT